MNTTESFWRTYFNHSLRVPWVIGPVAEEPAQPKAEAQAAPQPVAVPEVTEPFVFVTCELASSPALTKMLERMRMAIRQDEQSLRVVAGHDGKELRHMLKALGPKQKVMVFGPSQWPFKKVEPGEWQTLDGQAQAMVTHDLADLKANPNLKKYTWEHLQKFVGLK